MDIKSKTERWVGRDFVALIVALLFVATALQSIAWLGGLNIPPGVWGGAGGLLLTFYVWGVSKRIAAIEDNPSVGANPHAAATPEPKPVDPDVAALDRMRVSLETLRELLVAVGVLLDDPPDHVPDSHPKFIDWASALKAVNDLIAPVADQVPTSVGVRLAAPQGNAKRKVGGGSRLFVEYHIRAIRTEQGLQQGIAALEVAVSEAEQKLAKKRAAALLKRRAMTPRA